MGLFRSGVSVFAFRSSSKILSFVGIAIFSHLLAPGELGTFFLFQSVLGILTLISNFGISGALEKRISEGQEAGTVISAALLINVVIVLVLAVPVWASASYLDAFIGAPVTPVLLITIVLYQGHTLVRYYLRGRLNVGTAESLGTIHKLSWVIIGYVLVRYNLVENELIVALAVGWLIALLFGLSIESPRVGRPTRDMIVSVLDFSWFTFVLSITGFGFIWVDTILIGILLDRSSVAIYEIAWRVASVFTVFGYAVAETTFPSISKWSVKGETEAISSVVSQSLLLASVFVIPGFVGSVVLGDSVLGVIFGRTYGAGYASLVILMLYQILAVPGMILTRLVLGLDRPDVAAKAGALSGVMNITLNALLIPLFGIVGAAIATTGAFLVNIFLIAVWVNREFQFNLPYRKLVWCSVSAIFMGGIVYSIKFFVSVTDLITLGAVVGIGFVTYVFLLGTYGPLRAQLLARIRAVNG